LAFCKSSGHPRIAEKKLELLRALFEWNYGIDLKRLVEKGEEPDRVQAR
jgi:hypothetical protein